MIGNSEVTAKMSGEPYVFAWTFDFVQAIRERPLWARFLLRIAMGKYAYREFIGIMETLRDHGFYIDSGYELEHMKYHQKSIPFFDYLKINDQSTSGKL